MAFFVHGRVARSRDGSLIFAAKGDGGTTYMALGKLARAERHDFEWRDACSSSEKVEPSISFRAYLAELFRPS